MVVGRDYVREAFCVEESVFYYRQPEGAFSQPNGEVNQKMLNWAWKVMEQQQSDLLELYCGNGNFTMPLSRRVKGVLATEISKASIQAAQANMVENHIKNISLARLSAEELTQALSGVRAFRRLAGINLEDYDFRTIFVDPPRSGMDDRTCSLASRFDRILYISCNPETLVNNMKQLGVTHSIKSCALFDQFPYTEHMEVGVLLERS